MTIPVGPARIITFYEHGANWSSAIHIPLDLLHETHEPNQGFIYRDDWFRYMKPGFDRRLLVAVPRLQALEYAPARQAVRMCGVFRNGDGCSTQFQLSISKDADLAQTVAAIVVILQECFDLADCEVQCHDTEPDSEDETECE